MLFFYLKFILCNFRFIISLPIKASKAFLTFFSLLKNIDNPVFYLNMIFKRFKALLAKTIFVNKITTKHLKNFYF
ncbi:hypothetical protein T190130A13A_40173 [Tenacibaculum sp. 190130A14a]|uniref:Uncharacterized protein n=1 Tax=Tenacibaculum polynesiense TaxID=3137857 RepID=A0ABP1F4S9_9FLAO